jgi:hypothetical protein
MPMRDVEDVMSSLSAGGAEGVAVLLPPPAESRFVDQSTVIVVPTRGQIDSETVEHWLGLLVAPNQKRLGPLFARGYKVDAAYNALVAQVLAHPALSRFKYLMTLEDDNLPSLDAHLRLLETIESGPWDAVSGLYHTKDVLRTPMAYGDPTSLTRGEVDFSAAQMPANIECPPDCGSSCKTHVLEVNGIPMGCALWKLDLFRQLQPPWFVTVGDRVLLPDGTLVHPSQIPAGTETKRTVTQDLVFCFRARKAGKRFAVDLRVAVGHKDVETGIIY